MDRTTGAQLIDDRQSLLMRAGLLFEDYDLGHYVPKLEENLRQDDVVTPEDFDLWLTYANSQPALACIRRFAAVEADTASRDLKGQGRITTSIPRLGGVLSKPASKARVPNSVIQALVERTVHGSYLVTVLIRLQNGGGGIDPAADEEALWQRWIPTAYSPPENTYDSVMSVVAVASLWSQALHSWGLPKQAAGLNMAGDPLSTSVGGLVAAGVALGVVERSLPLVGRE